MYVPDYMCIVPGLFTMSVIPKKLNHPQLI